MVQYLTKGKSVVVVGELDADIRVDNSGVSRIDRSVVADSVTFLSVNSGTENNGNTTSTTQPKQETKKSYNQTNVVPSNDDEISAMTSRQTSAPAQEVFDDLPF
jgi:single-stranded DNA-binding protein